jgi:hypothetical protein
MTRLHKHKPVGESAADGVAPPAQKDAIPPPAAEQSGELVRSNRWIRSLLLWSVASLLLMAALQWADVVEWVDGEWRLKPQRETERDRQIRKIDEAEQYALVADISGYYACLQCPAKRIFMKANEVWKYGVTNQGEKQRYTTQFLRQRRLRYLVQLRGTYSQCLVEEKRKLFEYPLLPENLARPDSLKRILPPGNLQMR